MAKEKVKQSPKPDAELESQLDAVVAQAGQGANAAPGNATAATATAAAAAPPAEAADLSGDALAEQIQNLLDDAKAGAQGGKAQATDAARVEQIDEALADGAEDAVAGQFDTPEQVGVTTETTAADKPSSSAATVAAATTTPPDEKTDDNEPELDGAFASPEDLLKETAATPAKPGGFSADAASVARELDDEQKQHAVPAAGAPQRPKRVKVRRQMNLDGALRGVLVAINKPLMNASPATRNAWGWIALVTLFNGAVFLTSHVLFHSDAASAAESHEVASAEMPHEKAASGEGGSSHEAASSHEGEGKHEKAKPKSKAKPETKKAGKKPGKSEHSEHGE